VVLVLLSRSVVDGLVMSLAMNVTYNCRCRTSKRSSSDPLYRTRRYYTSYLSERRLGCILPSKTEVSPNVIPFH
jgi:hypothetical protein